MADKLSVLKEYFGYSEFRSGQGEIVDSLLSGRDAVCIMPTGAGKSICYQIPAMLMDGTAIVISPLISLMKDQVNALSRFGIPSACINSSLSMDEINFTMLMAEQGEYKVIYVAPERLETNEFSAMCKRIKISMIAVDEAHCVSQWGHDFRPSYLKIAEFISGLNARPVVGAFTATATREVKDDIVRALKLSSPLVVTTGFDRPNLFFSVIRPESKLQKLNELIGERRDKSGIVYCSTRKNVEEVQEYLSSKGFLATRYHAGLSELERSANQDDFLFDRKTVMVATNAFGMGIDKSNVSYVIHYNMPKDIESYYQEAGRAGRDGSEADCILMYSGKDVQINRFLITKKDDNPELTEEEQDALVQKELERLKIMTFYCTTNECLRGFMLKYFGEKADLTCDKCSNCMENYTLTDVTVDAQKILSCIFKTRERFGKSTIIKILKGSKEDSIISRELDKQSTYGIMKDLSSQRIRLIINYLEEQECIKEEGTDYPIIKLLPKSYGVLRGRLTLSMKVPKEAEPKKQAADAAKSRTGVQKGIDRELLDLLKLLRKEISQSEGVPAFVVFPDTALLDMCIKLPKTEDEFLQVIGVGKTKCQRYGERFMSVIRQYCD